MGRTPYRRGGVGVGAMFVLAFIFPFTLLFLFELVLSFIFEFMLALLAFAFMVEAAFVLFALPLEFLLPLPQSKRRTAVLSTTVRAITLNIYLLLYPRGRYPSWKGSAGD